MGIIRTILALSVVVWHSGGFLGWFSFNGTACVILFFIVSGFYMALILNEKYLGRGSVLLFWGNRFFRLWPSYVIAVLLTIPLRPELPLEIFRQISDPASLLLVVFSNVTMFAYEIENLLCLAPSGALSPCGRAGDAPISDLFYIGQGWSLGLELWFYLFAPFFVRDRIRLLVVGLAAAVFFMAVRRMGWDDVWIYLFFQSVALFFILGVASYHCGKALNKTRLGPAYRLAGLVILQMVAALLVFPQALTLIVPEQHHNKFFVGLFSIFIPAWFAWSKDLAWDNAIGNLSYPVYVVHYALINWLVEFGVVGKWFVFPVVVLTLAVAAAMYILVEAPVDRWRQQRIRAAALLPARAASS